MCDAGIANALDDPRFMEEWDGLCDTVGAHIFLRPEWYAAWSKHLKGDSEARVLTVRRAGRLVGVAPMKMHTVGPPGCRLVVLSHMLDGIADYTENLCMPAEAEVVAKALLGGAGGGWDVLRYRDVPVHSSLWKAFCDSVKDRTMVVRPASICPFIAPGRDWNSHLETAFRNSKKRNDFKRKTKKISKAKDLEILSEHALTDGSAEFEGLMEIEQSGWKGRRLTGLFVDPPHKDFYREVCGAFLAKRMLFAEIARISGRLSAYVMGFRDDRRWYVYTTSFDPRDAGLNTGFHVYYKAAERCLDQGCSEFDMLRGGAEYKNQITSTARRNYDLMVFRNRRAASAFKCLSAIYSRLKRMSRGSRGYLWSGTVTAAPWDASGGGIYGADEIRNASLI